MEYHEMVDPRGVGDKEKPIPLFPQERPAMKKEKIRRAETEWRETLTPEQYRVAREGGTERAFTGKYWNTKTPGTYACAACGEPLFSSDTKYDSGSGWPSFWEPVEPDAVETHEDRSLGMRRTEVLCRRCDAHLGHVFDDGPNPTGLRYCINSASLDLVEKKKDGEDENSGDS
jgi:peptide-methionine (R)-S-oxide reductase